MEYFKDGNWELMRELCLLTDIKLITKHTSKLKLIVDLLSAVLQLGCLFTYSVVNIATEKGH